MLNELERFVVQIPTMTFRITDFRSHFAPRPEPKPTGLFVRYEIDISLIENVALLSWDPIDHVENLLSDSDCLELRVLQFERLVCESDRLVLCRFAYPSAVRSPVSSER